MRNEWGLLGPLSLIACMLGVSTLQAADVSMVQVSSGSGSAHVNLDDWGWDAQAPLQVFADESWMSPGRFSINVDFMASDSGRGSLITVPTAFQKTVTNLTDFDWTGFTTTIIPSPGATISMVDGQPNTHFASVQVIDNNDGSYSIEWNSGTGVAVNEQASFDFSFVVAGPSSELVNYKLRQMPTPEPTTGCIVLMGAVSLSLRRWRRHCGKCTGAPD